MTTLDLLLFAENSQKIPTKITFPPMEKNKRKIGNLILIHAIDFIAVGTITILLMSFFLVQISKSFLVTDVLKRALSQEAVFASILTLFPFILLNYFFFSFLMNHGQSCAMIMTRKRIVMRSQSFKEALRWSTYSTLFCLSFGLSYFIKKSIWKNLREHDYLYLQLTSKKDNFTPINLVASVSEFEHKSYLLEEALKKAA